MSELREWMQATFGGLRDDRSDESYALERNGKIFRDRVWMSYLGTPLEIKRVKSSELQQYLEKGWVRGRWNRKAHTLLK